MGVLLEVAGLLSVSGEALTLEYECTNRGRGALFVALVTCDLSLSPVPFSAYTFLSPSGRLELLLGTSPIPTDREVEHTASPAFVKLEEWQTVRGEIRLPLPVREWCAHFPPEGARGDIAFAREVRLSIDHIRESEIHYQRAARGRSDLWHVGGASFLACIVEPAPLPIPVRTNASPGFPFPSIDPV